MSEAGLPPPSYDETSVRVLKGLEPVKERPGMYTRTVDPTHICQEIIDNAADEALGGFASRIDVTVHSDGSLSVQDNGRGIPVGLHPTEQVPVIELVFTRLHAGGKFNKKLGGAYAFSGGLHGVGVSVTNALSARLEVEVKRDSGIYRLVFMGGEVAEPLQRVDSCSANITGTRVRVWPDPQYFENAHYSVSELERLLRAKAVLLPGVKVTLNLEKATGGESREWYYPNGLEGYLAELCDGEEPVAPCFADAAFIPEGHEQFAPGEGAQWALAWFEEGAGGESYVNLIPTGAGGTHEAGLRAGVFEAVKSFIEHHNLLPRGVKLTAEDVWARLRFVLAARILDPQFQGQTKEKLTSRDALKLIAALTRDPVELWLNQHVAAGKKIAELAIRQAQTRLKTAKKVEKRKGSGVAVLPGKLTDCESEDISRNEIFLVEGDSAGGSAKLARDKEFQAVLPLRGKILNSWETDRQQLFTNAEIHDIAVAIGIDPHPPGEEVDLSTLRYGKIAILSDADVDGSHIQVLLLTLFYRHFYTLLSHGHIYIAQPPLFRIDVSGQGKGRSPRKYYALDQLELQAILDRLRAEGLGEKSWVVSRFKGLGEMNPDQLKDTTLHPDTRRLARVEIRPGAAAQTHGLFTMLMGRGEAAGRRHWMETHGNEVEADV